MTLSYKKLIGNFLNLIIMTNKTKNLKIGHVEVTNVSMNRASGYGQYTIATQIVFESTSETLNTHSTNSQLFDTLTDLDNNTERAEYLRKMQSTLSKTQ